MVQNVNDGEFFMCAIQFYLLRAEGTSDNNKNWFKAFLSPKNNYVSTGFVVQLTALLRSPTFPLVL